MKTATGEELNPADFPHYGDFTKYVRENIDPHWGRQKDADAKKTKFYKVMLSATVTSTATAEVEVEAEDADSAEELAKETVSKYNFSMSCIDIDEIEDINVDKVEEVRHD